jgi:hypothetical protein
MSGAATVRRTLIWLATVLTGCAALTLSPVVDPAYASNTFVEVTPNTAQPGTRVNVRANCDDSNNRQATVESDAFGRLMLRPDNGFLTGSVTIPGNKPPGTYNVNLSCPNGRTATTTLNVVNMSKPTQGPATGGGGMAGSGFGGPLLLIGGLAIVAAGAGLWLAGSRRGRVGVGR